MQSIAHITVAAIIKRKDKFLMVKEKANGLVVYNQPAGHWEVDETLIEAAQRETLEETAWEFKPEALVSIYRWKHPEKNEVFLRATFCGEVGQHHPNQSLDDGILEALWMSRDELAALPEIERRSAMVLQSIDDYEAGKRFDLNLLQDVIEHW
ncbi:MAG: NUDIX hydrolase [Pseudomonadota bacterium]